MTAIAICALALGLDRDDPGLAVVLGISVVPALILTELKARRRRRRDDPMSAGERIARVIVHPDGRIIPFDTYNLFHRDTAAGRMPAAVGIPLLPVLSGGGR